MDKIKLVKPQDATGEIAEIFQDIRKTKGDGYLTPTWGFFALDIDLLRHWWGLTKRLQMMDGDLPQALRNSISLICASEVDCPRCINNHQSHLIEHFHMSEDDVAEILDFENSDKVDPKTKAVLRFARKMAFTEGLNEEDFQALRDNGVTDRGVAEIVSHGHDGIRHGPPCRRRRPIRRRRCLAAKQPALGLLRRKHQPLNPAHGTAAIRQPR